MSDFYDAHLRWQEMVDKMQGVEDLQPVYEDEDVYSFRPIGTGMTVKFMDDMDGNLYHVFQVRRNGRALLVDENNDQLWANVSDLVIDENSLATKQYDGAEGVENIIGPAEVEVITQKQPRWKLAWIDYEFRLRDPVVLPSGDTGVIVGKTKTDSEVEYECLGDVAYARVEDKDLRCASKREEIGGGIPVGVYQGLDVEVNKGFWDYVERVEAGLEPFEPKVGDAMEEVSGNIVGSFVNVAGSLMTAPTVDPWVYCREEGSGFVVSLGRKVVGNYVECPSKYIVVDLIDGEWGALGDIFKGLAIASDVSPNFSEVRIYEVSDAKLLGSVTDLLTVRAESLGYEIVGGVDDE